VTAMTAHKTLVVLVPDKNVEFFLGGVLSRAGELGLRTPVHTFDAHAHRDWGCFTGDVLLASQAQRYDHALIMANAEPVFGGARDRTDLEADVVFTRRGRSTKPPGRASWESCTTSRILWRRFGTPTGHPLCSCVDAGVSS
jgi:hypothetical protein